MTISIAIVLGITLLAIIFFVTELVPVDITAFLVMVALMLTGILTPEEGLSGFSNVATITIFALLVLSIGLQSTGFINVVGEKLELLTGQSEWRIMLVTIVVVGFLSAFMNNTAVVAIFLPIVIRLAKHANSSASKFLMPLSFAAMIGGTATVIGTSTNIIVSEYYKDYLQSQDAAYAGQGFSIFEFSLLGIIFFLTFILFMFFIGWRIIPDRKKEDRLTKDYDLQKYLTQIEIGKNSPLLGKKLDETDLDSKYRVRVIGIIRKGGDVWLPQHIEAIRENDILVIKVNLENLLAVQAKYKVQIKKDIRLDDQELTSEQTVLFEAVIGQNSFLVGKRIKDVDFRGVFKALPLAIRRSGEVMAQKVAEMHIQFGDVLLMEARRQHLMQFYNSPDFIVLERVKKNNFRRKKMRRSSLIVLGVILAAAFNIVPIVVAALTGCALLFLTQAVSMRYVYRKMDWRVIFLLAGILPLGIAFEKTGTANLIAQSLLQVTGDLPVMGIISILFLATTLLTSFMSNNATAILLAPIAIQLAQGLGLHPKPFLLTVMFAASTSFLTPIGYQTNTLVYGAGQYTFMDFVKVGGVLTLIVWLLATLLIPLLYF